MDLISTRVVSKSFYHIPLANEHMVVPASLGSNSRKTQVPLWVTLEKKSDVSKDGCVRDQMRMTCEK